jgi:acyl-homoserine-lactone acylase
MRSRGPSVPVLVLVLAAAVTGACTTPGSDAPPAGAAEIRRTEDGVAHVLARDWHGLGVGQGYATAQDRDCTILESVLTVRGELSRWFGAGPNDANITSDLAYRHLKLHDDADRRWGGQPADVADMVAGYVAGVNAYLRDVGPAGVHGWCAGKPWVQPITTTDLYAVASNTLLFASAGALLPAIAAAAPPAPGAGPGPTVPMGTGPGASNGWALGADKTSDGGGMLLANPHFPWEGPQRFHEVHLTIPGAVDVYGAALTGTPGVQIGFNNQVAWTHTVSAGKRFTVDALTLDPADPTVYRYGDTTRAMTPDEITVQVAQPDGSLAPVTRTLWNSHYGPMLALPPGWGRQQAFTLRDANAGTNRSLQQWLGMDRARSMDELQAVHRDVTGIPWVNTVATSRDGRAWFADTSATPNLSPDTLARHQAAVAAGGLAAAFAAQGITLLNGSDPADEWVDAPGAAAPGLVPFAQMPALERRDYVFNANDSYWLTNPRQLLTGFSPLQGPVGVPQQPRTRTNVELLEQPGTGPDGRWQLPDLIGAFWSNRAITADLLLGPMTAACTGAPGLVALPDGRSVDIAPSCRVLATWDGDYDIDSRGAILWREIMTVFPAADRQQKGALFADAFDPADPAGTPRVPVADTAPWLTAIATAVDRLAGRGIPVDATLGDWQYDGRAGGTDAGRIGLPGGTNVEGAANVVDCCSGYRSPSGAPVAAPGAPGYPVTRGSSFVMAVDYGPDGPPQAEAVLTYGQPDDPADPGFTAESREFGAERFHRVRFTGADMDAGTTSRTEVTG